MIDAHVHVWGEELLGVPWLQGAAEAPIRQPVGLDSWAAEAGRYPDGEVGNAILVTADETRPGQSLLLARAAAS
ncbi:MAG: hypothetical protein LBR19_03795, partial [Bifidobacteriaceae bacterium]|nr:hypothetical protein [Bifidobacteriaceae bacterium]